MLTVITAVLHRAKPRGAIAGLGRAEPRGHFAFGRARLNPDCLASLRPSERNGTELELVKME